MIRGIDPNAFITMDIGRKRNLADVLSIQGEANPQNLAGALSWIRRYLTGNMLFYGATHEQHFTILSQDPSIRDSVAFCSNQSKPAGYPGQPSITVACHYLFSKADPVKAGELIKGYVIGLELGGISDPIYRLREQVIGYRNSKLKPTPQQMFGLFCFPIEMSHRIGWLTQYNVRICYGLVQKVSLELMVQNHLPLMPYL